MKLMKLLIGFLAAFVLQIQTSNAQIWPNGGGGGGSAAGITVGTSVITSGTSTRVLYDNAGIVGEAASLLINSTAGQGPSIVGGIAITAVNAQNITQTWNEGSTNFTAKLNNITNIASATSTTAPTSYLEQWQIGGVVKASIRKNGEISAGVGTVLLPALTLDTAGGNYDSGFYQISNATWGWTRGGAYQWSTLLNLISMKSTHNIGFAADATAGAGLDTNWSRCSAGLSCFGTGTQGSTAGSISLTGITASGSAILFSGLATDAAHTDATACVDSSTGQIYKGSGTIGICLGTSSERYKTGIKPLTVGLNEVLALKPVSYYTDKEHGNPDKLLYGFTAEQGETALPELVGKDSEGRPNSFDYLGVVPALVKAVQEQQVMINKLREELDELKSIKYVSN